VQAAQPAVQVAQPVSVQTTIPGPPQVGVRAYQQPITTTTTYQTAPGNVVYQQPGQQQVIMQSNNNAMMMQQNMMMQQQQQQHAMLAGMMMGEMMEERREERMFAREMEVDHLRREEIACEMNGDFADAAMLRNEEFAVETGMW
jgi:hypothetical protein